MKYDNYIYLLKTAGGSNFLVQVEGDPVDAKKLLLDSPNWKDCKIIDYFTVDDIPYFRVEKKFTLVKA